MDGALGGALPGGDDLGDVEVLVLGLPVEASEDAGCRPVLGVLLQQRLFAVPGDISDGEA
jgi:hypothetical protein